MARRSSPYTCGQAGQAKQGSAATWNLLAGADRRPSSRESSRQQPRAPAHRLLPAQPQLPAHKHVGAGALGCSSRSEAAGWGSAVSPQRLANSLSQGATCSSPLTHGLLQRLPVLGRRSAVVQAGLAGHGAPGQPNDALALRRQPPEGAVAAGRQAGRGGGSGGEVGRQAFMRVLAGRMSSGCATARQACRASQPSLTTDQSGRGHRHRSTCRQGRRGRQGQWAQRAPASARGLLCGGLLQRRPLRKRTTSRSRRRGTCPPL